MSVRSGQSITVIFTTYAYATGAATDATGTPTGTLYVNGTSNAASVTVTNITTGLYKAAVTLPTLAIGDLVHLNVNATVSAVTNNVVVWWDTKDVDLSSIGGVTLADGVAHGGTPGSSTATLAAKLIDVTNSDNNVAVTIHTIGVAGPVALDISSSASAGMSMHGGGSYGMTAFSDTNAGVHIGGGTGFSEGGLLINGGDGHDIVLNGDGKFWDNANNQDVSTSIADFTLPTESTGTPSTFVQMIMWIAGMLGWRKVIKDGSGHTIKQYMADSTTVKTTSTFTSAGNTDTLGKAS